MTTTEAILQHLQSLPDSAQREVLDFVRFLESRREELIQRDEDAAWSHFSLASALCGMEDKETPYSLSDLKESFSGREAPRGSAKKSKTLDNAQGGTVPPC